MHSYKICTNLADGEKHEKAKQRIQEESIFSKNNRRDSGTKIGQLKLNAQKNLPKRTSTVDINNLIVKKKSRPSDAFDSNKPYFF
jgi:hypothetical protein